MADGITAGGENTIVKDCYIYNPPDSGIMFSGAQNGLCINNRLEGGTDLGIYVNDGNNGANLLENVISGNRVTNFPNGGIALKRVSSKTTVANNTILNCGNGITLEQASSTTDYSKNITIIGNRIRNVTVNVGIDIRTSPYCVVVGNRIENFAITGLTVEGDSHHCTVIGNVISSDGSVTALGTYRAGIFMVSRQNIFPSYNIIDGNTVDITNANADNILAMYLVSLESKTSGGDHNIITNNVLKSTANYGSRIASPYVQNIVSNNMMSGAVNDLYVNGGIQNTIAHNTFVNNTPIGLDFSTETYVQKIGTQKVTRGSAAPTSGTWAVGDICYHTAPAASGNIGWVCTAAGTPGTWKTFGIIGA